MIVAYNYDYNSSSIPIIAQELSGHRVAVGCCLTHEIDKIVLHTVYRNVIIALVILWRVS